MPAKTRRQKNFLEAVAHGFKPKGSKITVGQANRALGKHRKPGRKK